MPADGGENGRSRPLQCALAKIDKAHWYRYQFTRSTAKMAKSVTG
jgi:hypothetical protein